MKTVSKELAHPRKQGFLAALFYPSYRYLWASTLGGWGAVSIEQIVTGWLVLELTDSPAMVGIVAACRYGGMWLAPLGGALADRFNLRRILILLQVANFAYALGLALLFYAGQLEVWHIFVMAVFSGTVRGIDHTTRNAAVPSTVEPQNVTSGVGLLLVSQGITTLISASAAGLLYKNVGAGGCFTAMASAYLLAGLLLVPMRLAPIKGQYQAESVLASTLKGLRYTIKDRSLLALVILAAIANMFVFPCTFGIMPVFAKEVLNVGADGLGWLIAAEGLGGLIGALMVSALGKTRLKGILLLILMIIWPLTFAIFSTTRVLPVSLLVLVISGITRGSAMALIQVLILNWAIPEMRGRVIGVRMSVIITLMAGNLISGVGAGWWGSPTMIVLNAIAGVATTALTAWWAPRLRHKE